jgi:hypothetical protein
MKKSLLAILLLIGWTRVRGDEEPPPDPPGRTLTVNFSTMIGGTRQVRQLTLRIPDPSAPADEDDEPRRPPPVGRIDLNSAIFARENFDRWLFDKEQTEEARLSHLERILSAQIEAAALRDNLTARERTKLRLAGRGDIKRFFDQVEGRRSQFEIARKSFKSGHAALLALTPLTKVYQEGPFGDGSLFAKTLRKVRDDREADGSRRPSSN